MLELNEVVLEGEPRTLTLMAREGQLTCLTGGTPGRRTRWLHAMMGFEPLKAGVVSIDGEPLCPATLSELRSLMAFVPARLTTLGEVVTYESPSVQDVFALKGNRQLPISNGILAEEMKRTGVTGEAAQWLAVAVLRRKPILLVDNPPSGAATYLQRQAASGTAVIIASADSTLVSLADNVAELTES